MKLLALRIRTYLAWYEHLESETRDVNKFVLQSLPAFDLLSGRGVRACIRQWPLELAGVCCCCR